MQRWPKQTTYIRKNYPSASLLGNILHAVVLPPDQALRHAQDRHVGLDTRRRQRQEVPLASMPSDRLAQLDHVVDQRGLDAVDLRQAGGNPAEGLLFLRLVEIVDSDVDGEAAAQGPPARLQALAWLAAKGE